MRTDHPPCRTWNWVHRGQLLCFHRSLMSDLLNLWTRKKTACSSYSWTKTSAVQKGKRSWNVKLRSEKHLFLTLHKQFQLPKQSVGPTAQSHKSPLRWVTAAQGRFGVSDEGQACENSQDHHAIAHGECPTTQRNSPTEDFLTFAAMYHQSEFMREALLQKSEELDFILLSMCWKRQAYVECEHSKSATFPLIRHQNT